MARETEAKHLDPNRVRAGVAAVFSEAERGRYLLAARDGTVVAALLLTKEWSDWRNGWYWWIQSVYVVPAARRSGVFRALYEHVIHEACEREDVRAIRLYVEEGNASAQKVYEDLGMDRRTYQFFERDLAEFNGER